MNRWAHMCHACHRGWPTFTLGGADTKCPYCASTLVTYRKVEA